MPKTGRNDPCPCGSGQKYKRCCIAKDQAAEQATLAAERAKLEARKARSAAKAAQYRDELQKQVPGAYDETEELNYKSNSVVDLIADGKLDEAEQVARALLVDYPEVFDGHDRLGMVHEARGEDREAIDCYGQVVAFIRADPEQFEPGYEEEWLDLIAKLEAPAAPAAD